MPTTLTIGSRRSLLARTQTNIVRQMIKTAWPNVEVDIELIDTQGDLNRTTPLPEIGGKGLFTSELEKALREQRIDLAVHSLKDLPIEDSPQLTIIAIPFRAPVNDVLVCRQANRVEDLPSGAVVGTSSLRRASQIQAIRPDIKIKDIRGNVETRLKKLDDPAQGYTAIVLAQAGLNRLNYQLDYAHTIPFGTMLPAPGQGALGIQGRLADAEVSRFLQPLDHRPTRSAVMAERSFLAGLGGGCSIPVASLGQIDGRDLTLMGLVAQPDGQQVIHVKATGSIDEPLQLGQRLAQDALAQGAEALLDS